LTGEQRAARQLVRLIVDRYNARDVEGLVALYHDDAAYWSPLGDWQHGVGPIRAHLDELHRTLPDEQMSIEALVTDGVTAVVEFKSSGTSPAGKTYSIEFTEVIEIEDAKIKRVMVYLDPDEVQAITG